jgi:K+-transporting ATPase ATPase C chain
MKNQVITALKVLLIMTVITGVIYPVLILGIGQIAFNRKANGSLISRKGVILGSELIGQKFDSSAYFWPRPSAIDYNPLPSSGSNLGPTSKELKYLVTKRKAEFIWANGLADSTNVPAEMLFASASGLDPHISPQAVYLQVDRIAKARKFNENEMKELNALIQKMIEEPQFSLFGEPRVNVFLLNLELDNIR